MTEKPAVSHALRGFFRGKEENMQVEEEQIIGGYRKLQDTQL